MINIFELYQALQGRVNSHQGGHIKPSNFVQWAHETQMNIYRERIADFQKTQLISDDITGFLQSANVLLKNVAGSGWDLITKSPEYGNYASSRIIKKGGVSVACNGLEDFDCDGNKITGEKKCGRYVDPDEAEIAIQQAGKNDCELPIELVDNSRWSAICTHPRKKVTCASPKMTQYGSGFKIAPKGCATSIIMDFFKVPTKPVFNFIIINPQSEGEYIQFVPAGSVNLDWPESLLPEFLSRLMNKYAAFTGNDAMWTQARVEQKEK